MTHRVKISSSPATWLPKGIGRAANKNDWRGTGHNALEILFDDFVSLSQARAKGIIAPSCGEKVHVVERAHWTLVQCKKRKPRRYRELRSGAAGPNALGMPLALTFATDQIVGP
jgi:hypothetical protein